MVPTSHTHLPHLDGIRGLAIALVVVFHVFVGKVSSGVDVFLFVGGLLLLSSQLRYARDPAGPTLLESVTRILRRLLPALVTVVTTTVVGVLALYSRVDWGPLLSDASASLTYWVNWRLIGLEADYDAASGETSPFQHLWSMSVQLQIYLAIIALVFGTRWAANRLSRRPHDAWTRGPAGGRRWIRTVIAAVALATAASFAYATWMTFAGHQTANYYSTFSRFWEIGAGALLGLALFAPSRPAPRLSLRMRATLSWTGLGLIFSVGLFFDGAEQFPGALTLVPIVGAMLLVVAGLTPAADGPARDSATSGRTSRITLPWVVRSLESRALVRLGTIAYGLYLWHWPLLILTVHATGLEAGDPVVGVPVIAASVLLASLTHRYVETPLRRKRGQVPATMAPSPPPLAPETGDSARGASKDRGICAGDTVSTPSSGTPAESPPRRSAAPRRPSAASAGLGALFAVIVVSPQLFGAATALQQRVDEGRISEALAEGRPDTYPGAAEILDGIEPRPGVPVFPGLASRDPMMPPATVDECTTDKDDDEITFHKSDGSPCHYGDTSSERTIYLVGGSHSEHWLGALDEIGRERGIRFVTFLRAGCPLYLGGESDAGCHVWSERVEEHIHAEPPTDGVFTVSTRPAGLDVEEAEYVPQEYVDVFERLAEAGNTVFAIRDNPWLRDEDDEQLDPRECVTRDPTLVACTVPADRALAPQNPAEDVLDGDEFVHLDLSEALIKDQQVFPVIGNVLVYRDWNHLTDQYVRTLVPELDRQMFED